MKVEQSYWPRATRREQDRPPTLYHHRLRHRHNWRFVPYGVVMARLTDSTRPAKAPINLSIGHSLAALRAVKMMRSICPINRRLRHNLCSKHRAEVRALGCANITADSESLVRGAARAREIHLIRKNREIQKKTRVLLYDTGNMVKLPLDEAINYRMAQERIGLHEPAVGPAT